MASVPSMAVWVDGKKGKRKVLLDKAGYRLRQEEGWRQDVFHLPQEGRHSVHGVCHP